MNKYFNIAIVTALSVAITSFKGNAMSDLSQYVDPFIGVDGGGNVFPGPCVPFGMVKVGPDCGGKDWNAGWDRDGNIHGFSNVHVSGTGGGCKYGNVLFAPITGNLDMQDYSSPRNNEHVALGLYEVDLKRYGTSARLTALQRSAMHEYTFPASDDSKIIIDLGSFLSSHERQYLVGSEVRIISDKEIEGYTRVRGGWNIGEPYTVYFYAVFDTPSDDCGTWKSHRVEPGKREQYDTSEPTGAYFSYRTSDKQKVTVKVGISYLSTGKARMNLSEMNSWNFDEVRAACVSRWNEILNKIEVKGSDEQKKIFYTALYHSYLQPVDKTGENSKWISDEPYYDDYYCIWDTFRATHPLFTLLTPSKQVDMLRSLLDIYRYEGYAPDARSGDDNGRGQGGSNVDILFTDAYVKGLKGIDYELALEAMIKNAEVSPGDDERKEGRGGISDYNEKGFVSTKFERAGTRTMEYANCDYAIATLARGLKEKEIAQKYMERSRNWQNLWNPDVESLGFKGFVWPRYSDGSWWSENDYSVFQGGTWPDFVYETFSWELSFYVPHDVNALIEKCGGKEQFTRRLDTYFSHEKWDQRWYMGLFQISNEPGFLTPTLYNYVGRPDKTAEVVRKTLKERYNTTKEGIPGNDDSGSMSSWYVFHALGFYPNTGQDLYLISSPTFEEAVIHLENGRDLSIKAKKASDKNIYVQSVKLNGEPLDACSFKHTDIANGGTLEFVMGSKPSKWGTVGVENQL